MRREAPYRRLLRRCRDSVDRLEKAAEIIDSLEAAGIKHVSFKLGSVEGIREVINVAAANPNFPIILR